MTFDKCDGDHNRPANGILTTAEHARRVELHFERCAERQLFSDLNLARAIQLDATLQELDMTPC